MGKSKAKDKGMMGLLIGTGVAIAACVGAAAALAQLVVTEKVGEGSADALITVILLLSSVLGNITSITSQGNKPLVSAAITTAVLLLLMVVGGLIIDGKFENCLLRVMAVVAGGLISCIFCLKKSGKPVRRKKRYR